MVKMTDEIPELDEAMTYICYLNCSNFSKKSK